MSSIPKVVDPTISNSYNPASSSPKVGKGCFQKVMAIFSKNKKNSDLEEIRLIEGKVKVALMKEEGSEKVKGLIGAYLELTKVESARKKDFNHIVILLSPDCNGSDIDLDMLKDYPTQTPENKKNIQSFLELYSLSLPQKDTLLQSIYIKNETIHISRKDQEQSPFIFKTLNVEDLTDKTITMPEFFNRISKSLNERGVFKKEDRYNEDMADIFYVLGLAHSLLTSGAVEIFKNISEIFRESNDPNLAIHFLRKDFSILLDETAEEMIERFIKTRSQEAPANNNNENDDQDLEKKIKEINTLFEKIPVDFSLSMMNRFLSWARIYKSEIKEGDFYIYATLLETVLSHFKGYMKNYNPDNINFKDLDSLTNIIENAEDYKEIEELFNGDSVFKVDGIELVFQHAADVLGCFSIAAVYHMNEIKQTIMKIPREELTIGSRTLLNINDGPIDADDFFVVDATRTEFQKIVNGLQKIAPETAIHFDAIQQILNARFPNEGQEGNRVFEMLVSTLGIL
ncbi:MAG: hypothetical protein WDZ28_01715 [Simkaniaceae bacterium]